MIDLRSDTVTRPTRPCGRPWLGRTGRRRRVRRGPDRDRRSSAGRRHCSGTRPGCSAPPARWRTCSASGCWSSRARRCSATSARTSPGRRWARTPPSHGLTMRTFPSIRGRLDVDSVAAMHRAGRRSVPGLDRRRGGREHPQLRRRHRPAARPAGQAVGAAVPRSRSRLPPRRRPAVERARRVRGRAERLRPAVRHRQRLLLQGARRTGRVGARRLGGPASPGPGSGASDSAAAGGRPASSRPARLYALDHHVDRLADDHAAARALRRRQSPSRRPTAVDPGGGRDQHRGAATPASEPAARGGCGPRPRTASRSRSSARGSLRAVTHLDVTAEQCVRAGEALGRLLRS